MSGLWGQGITEITLANDDCIRFIEENKSEEQVEFPLVFELYDEIYEKLYDLFVGYLADYLITLVNFKGLTGRKLPGSTKTKRLRKKRDKAIFKQMKWKPE